MANHHPRVSKRLAVDEKEKRIPFGVLKRKLRFEWIFFSLWTETQHHELWISKVNGAFFFFFFNLATRPARSDAE